MTGYVSPAAHGNLQGTFRQMVTEENISGVRAVAVSQSGNLRVAMAAVSGRMPAIGIVIDNRLSGEAANVYTVGQYQFASGMANFSGYLGKKIWVGRSGNVAVLSGTWSSGGYLSGDLGQGVGITFNSGNMIMSMDTVVWSGGPLGAGTGGLW